MELKNINEIITLLRNKVTLYGVFPYVSGGKIVNNKVFEITDFYHYRWGLDIIFKNRLQQLTIFKHDYSHVMPNIEPTDVINTNVRVYTTIDDAKKGLAESLRILSYEAIESVDRVLRQIDAQKKSLKDKEEKYSALKQSYYKLSVTKFSK